MSLCKLTSVNIFDIVVLLMMLNYCWRVLVPGLFSQAVIQSGSPLSFWAVHDNQVDLDDYVRRLADHVTCRAELMQDIVACLKTVDWKTLTDSVDEVDSMYCSIR